MTLKCVNVQSIIEKIEDRFLYDYNYGVSQLPENISPVNFALTNNKRNAFWKRYYNEQPKQSRFRRLIDNSYLSFWKQYYDFLLNSKSLSYYLREDLKNAEVIFIEKNRVSALDVKQIEEALSAAKNITEFNWLIVDGQKRVQKVSIWFELEKRLSNEITIPQ